SCADPIMQAGSTQLGSSPCSGEVVPVRREERAPNHNFSACSDSEGTEHARAPRPGGAALGSDDQQNHAPDAAARWRAMKASNSARSLARLSSSTNSAKARASSSRRRRSSSSRWSSRRRYSSNAKLPVEEKCGRARKVPDMRLKLSSKNFLTSLG